MAVPKLVNIGEMNVIKNVFIIGAGTMGNGIAQVAAEAGYSVTMMDVKEEFLKRGMAAIERSLDRRIKKGEIKDENKREILSRIATSWTKDASKHADIVIEAAPEVLSLNQVVGSMGMGFFGENRQKG